MFYMGSVELVMDRAHCDIRTENRHFNATNNPCNSIAIDNRHFISRHIRARAMNQEPIPTTQQLDLVSLAFIRFRPTWGCVPRQGFALIGARLGWCRSWGEVATLGANHEKNAIAVKRRMMGKTVHGDKYKSSSHNDSRTYPFPIQT